MQRSDPYRCGSVGSARQVPSTVWSLNATVQESPAARPLQAATISGAGAKTRLSPSGLSGWALVEPATNEPARKNAQRSPFPNFMLLLLYFALHSPKPGAERHCEEQG